MLLTDRETNQRYRKHNLLAKEVNIDYHAKFHLLDYENGINK